MTLWVDLCLFHVVVLTPTTSELNLIWKYDLTADVIS